MQILYKLRLHFKHSLRLLPGPVYLWLQSHTSIMDSYCKECGRSVHDFIAPDEVWDKIKPLIKHGNVLCYDCFCNKCNIIGVTPVWYLTKETYTNHELLEEKK